MHHHDASGHSLANNCSAPSNTATAGRSQVPRCASSPRPHGAAKLFGCTTVRTATGISSSSQSRSTRSIISSSSRDRNIHCFDVSTGRHSFNGPLTEAGIPDASPWQAAARSSQPPLSLSHCGTLRRTRKSGVSFTIRPTSCPWPPHQTTTL